MLSRFFITLINLYNLNKRLQVWDNKPGFGIKSVNNILNAIEDSRQLKLENFICALGIPHVGKTLSKEQFDNLLLCSQVMLHQCLYK